MKHSQTKTQRMICSAIATLCLTLGPYATLAAPAAKAKRPQRTQLVGAAPATQTTVDAAAGFAILGGDHFTSVEMSGEIRLGELSLEFMVPIRYRIADRAPVDGSPNRGLRVQDWDEASEWLRFIHRLQIKDDKAGLSGQIGELAGVTIGHGSLVNQYYNTLLPDHFKAGLRVDIDHGRWAVQSLVNDVVAWQVVALRGLVRPLDRLQNRLLRSLTLATTVAVDRQAPSRVRLDADGLRQFDAQQSLVVDHEPLVIYGFDFGFELLRDKSLAVVPYLDINTLATTTRLDGGLHAGVLLDITPLAKTLRMALRYEMRISNGAYRPAWFDTMYEIERYRYQALSIGNAPLTKLAYERARASTSPRVRSHLVSVDMKVLSTMQLIGQYEHVESQPQQDSAVVRLNLPRTRYLEMNLFGAMRPSAPGGEQHWIAAISSRVQLYEPLYAWVDYQRAWHLQTGDDPRYGQFDDWTYGVGIQKKM